MKTHPAVRLGQELVLACDLEDEDFFQLSGLLPNQMLYLVWLTTGRLGMAMAGLRRCQWKWIQIVDDCGR